jgi:sulfoxide reductase heme-binding subunit YedZ
VSLRPCRPSSAAALPPDLETSLPEQVSAAGPADGRPAPGSDPASRSRSVRLIAWLRQPAPQTVTWIRRLACILALVPLGRLVAGVVTDRLGANPIEVITRATGEWTLILLLVTLTITPLRRLTGMNWLLRLRRMLGLTAFFYGCLHLVTYLWLDQFFDMAAIVTDIVKRPFITAGFVAFLLLVPLAITSTDAMVRRMGGRRWLALHRLAYIATAIGVVHYWWLVKADVREPLFYAVILALLLAVRLAWRRASTRTVLEPATRPLDRSRR